MNHPKNVIFFDGVCGLCNGFVDFIIAIDKKRTFLFSPLQSEYAQKNLPDAYSKDLKTIVAIIDGKTYTKSQAVLKVLNELGGIWKFMSFARIFPHQFRDSIYDMIAQNRYKLFGEKESCRLPTPEERQRFIV